MECKKDACSSTRNCQCKVEGCPNHGRCCKCLSAHGATGEMPACLATKDDHRLQ